MRKPARSTSSTGPRRFVRRLRRRARSAKARADRLRRLRPGALTLGTARSSPWLRRAALAAALLGVAFMPYSYTQGPAVVAADSCHKACRAAQQQNMLKWTQPLPGDWNVLPGLSGTVPGNGLAYAATGNGVVALGYDMTVYAYSADSGKPLWQFPLSGFPAGAAIVSVRTWPGEVTVGVAYQGQRTEVVISDTTHEQTGQYPAARFGGAVAGSAQYTVIVGRTSVISYDNANGHIRWQRQTGQVAQGWQTDGQNLYVAESAGGYLGSSPITALRRIDVATGAEQEILPAEVTDGVALQGTQAFDGTLVGAFDDVVLFSAAGGVTAYSGITGDHLWSLPGALPEGADPRQGRIYLSRASTLIAVKPQSGKITASAPVGGLYAVRDGVALGLDQGANGDAWGYYLAGQRVTMTAPSLGWPHFFVDLSGLGGSIDSGGDLVILAACAQADAAAAAQPSPSGSAGVGSPPATNPSATPTATPTAPVIQACVKPELVALSLLKKKMKDIYQNGTGFLVCGAGFGGMAAVATLKRAKAQVTVLDANLYSTFQPLLYQVATAGLNPGDVSHPVGASARRHGAVYRRGELAAIDAEARRVKLADGREFGYEYLVIATGMTASHFGIKGAVEHTFGLYTRKDAIVLRDHFMAGIERLSEADGDFNLTVVGGGATGVELAGALAELRAVVLRSTFPDVDPSRLKVRLVEMAPSLLTPFPEKLQAYTLGQLRRRGVDVLLNTRIDEVRADRVMLGAGDSIPSDLTVWAAGVAAPPEVAGWGLPQGKNGRIIVGPDLRVKGQERIFAVGDIAINPDDPVPQTAQPAIQMGKHAARQIMRLRNGQQTEPFSYHDKGDMATIGRKSAVVRLHGGLRMRGTLAWLAWLGLHLFYLLGFRNRVTTLINLSWRYLAWGHGGAVIVGDEPVGSTLWGVKTTPPIPPACDASRRYGLARPGGPSGTSAAGRPRSSLALAAVATVFVLGLGACSSSGSSGGGGSGNSQEAAVAGGPGQSNAALQNPNLDTGTSLNGVPAPDIKLTNQFGRPASLGALHGKVVLLGFEDSQCTNVCPLTTQSMVWAKQLLGSAGDQVALLGVDANPNATTVSDVLAYSRTHGMLNEWNFLTGPLPQLRKIWTEYHIAVQVEQGLIDHTPALFVIDQRGREQKLYLTQMAYSSVSQAAQVLADEISTLLPGHPKVGSQQSLASVAVQGPDTHVALDPATGTDSVALGPGKSRLVMFFATWLSQTSDLKSELAQGNAYTAWAAKNGMPPLTGVDETVVEPSKSFVRTYLAGLGLRYPVGLDSSGRVADGYQVQDQPWFALVNAAGKVTWQHDGWLSLTALEAAVKHAA